MGEDDCMKFRQKLLEIDHNLGSDDVDSLKFLCSDLIAVKKLEKVESAHSIFDLLISHNFVNKEDLFLIGELLYRIKYISLLHVLGFTKEYVQANLPQRRRVSEYRQMLYEISEDLSEDEVKRATFLLRDYLPKKQPIATGLELLTSLEKQNLLAESNLNILKDVCVKISPDLLKKVEIYQKKGDDKAGSRFGVFEASLQQHAGNDESKTERSAIYEMGGPHRGYCLIFNNMHFGELLSQRNGSEKDAMDLKQIFTWLGLEVMTYNDQTATEMHDCLKQWQSSECWKDRDCLVCCILSHGESGQIFGTDEQKISIRTIMSYFSANRCPFLAKKPKLFFIQACQGEKTQMPFYLEADSNKSVSVGADAQASGFVPSLSIPAEADFLLGMATVDGYLSFRHVSEGTWYIQALCKKLQLLVPSGEDILSILTAVNEDVSQRASAQGQKKQMPQPAYTLRKKLIFPVPKEPFLES